MPEFCCYQEFPKGFCFIICTAPPLTQDCACSGDIVFTFNMDDHSNQGNTRAINDTVRNVRQSGFPSCAHEELNVELVGFLHLISAPTTASLKRHHTPLTRQCLKGPWHLCSSGADCTFLLLYMTTTVP